jgi:hypothetical protein
MRAIGYFAPDEDPHASHRPASTRESHAGKPLKINFSAFFAHSAVNDLLISLPSPFRGCLGDSIKLIFVDYE